MPLLYCISGYFWYSLRTHADVCLYVFAFIRPLARIYASIIPRAHCVRVCVFAPFVSAIVAFS